MQVAIQEARRLQRFGVTQAEADTYRQATLRDNFMASMQADYVPAQEILEFLMETLATRGVFSDNQQVQARSLSVCVRYQHLHLHSCSWPCLLTTSSQPTPWYHLPAGSLYQAGKPGMREGKAWACRTSLHPCWLAVYGARCHL